MRRSRSFLRLIGYCRYSGGLGTLRTFRRTFAMFRAQPPAICLQERGEYCLYGHQDGHRDDEADHGMGMPGRMITVNAGAPGRPRSACSQMANPMRRSKKCQRRCRLVSPGAECKEIGEKGHGTSKGRTGDRRHRASGGLGEIPSDCARRCGPYRPCHDARSAAIAPVKRPTCRSIPKRTASLCGPQRSSWWTMLL